MMKYLYFLLITLFTSSLTVGQGIEFEHVEWREAVKMAKKENKLIFIDAYAQWCGPCKKMAKYEFTKENVGNFFNKNFINLKLDMESKDGRTFDAQYPVSAYPTLIFMDGEGNVVRREKGGRKGDQLISMGKKVLNSFDFAESYEEKYMAGDRDYDLVLNYVMALNKGQGNGLKVANDYLSSNPEITPEQRLKFIFESVVESDSKLFTEMVENRKEIIKIVGEDEYNTRVSEACQATVEKSVEFEAPFLFDEALAAAKKGLTKDYDDFALYAKMQYAASTKDAKLFSEGIGKSVKKNKDDVKALKALLRLIDEKFYEEESLKHDYVDIAEIIYKKEKTYSELKVYAAAIEKSGKIEKAIKLLKKEKSNFADNKGAANAIDRMIFKLENKL